MHKSLRSLIALLILATCTNVTLAQGIETYTRTNPRFLAAFRDAAAAVARSTVRVNCNSREVALGMIIGADGWILTKANDLEGDISCQLAVGGVYRARLIGVHAEHDLAVLKIDAKDLPTIRFKDSRALAPGAWLVSPGFGEESPTVGVVSVATRTLPPNSQGSMFVNPNGGYLGVALEEEREGARVLEVMPKSGAASAGLQEADLIRIINGRRVYSPEDVLRALQRSKPGDVVMIQFRRGNDDYERAATLSKRPPSNRADFQNSLGGQLSNRRSGYSIILQHDSVIRPMDCGGPLVDLDGGVVGMNVSRVGRTETFAVPAEIINPLLTELMSGRLAPRGDESRQPAQ